MVRSVPTLLALLAMGLAGALVGMIAGAAAGFTYVEIAHTSTFEGERGMTVFFGCVPMGALLGAIALPAVYLVMRARQEKQAPVDAGNSFNDGQWPG